MINILHKLASRKLWVTIGGIATGIAVALGVDGGEISTVAGAITALISAITYVITEGKIDAESVKQVVEKSQEAVEVIENESK